MLLIAKRRINHMAKNGVTKSCPACSKIFYRPPSRADQITCSRTCRARLMQDKGAEVGCKRCGALFWRTLSSAKLGYGNYCSHACWGADRKTPLGIANNAWTPRQRMEWTGNNCVRCGSEDNLELDHVLARSLGGLSVRDNTQTLCKRCNLQKWQCEDLPAHLSAIKLQP